MVIFLISAFSVIGYQMGYSTGMTITFFPMIIIAWTIERMSILWEEDGPTEVMKQGGGSLLVAVLAYLLMQLPIDRAPHVSIFRSLIWCCWRLSWRWGSTPVTNCPSCGAFGRWMISDEQGVGLTKAPAGIWHVGHELPQRGFHQSL